MYQSIVQCYIWNSLLSQQFFVPFEAKSQLPRMLSFIVLLLQNYLKLGNICWTNENSKKNKCVYDFSDKWGAVCPIAKR